MFFHLQWPRRVFLSLQTWGYPKLAGCAISSRSGNLRDDIFLDGFMRELMINLRIPWLNVPSYPDLRIKDSDT